MKPIYRTKRGVMYRGNSQDVLENSNFRKLKNKVNLIFTSPPFPLNKKKAYGNLTGKNYSSWLASFADIFHYLLTPDGSLVIELGNAWVKGSPTMSLLPLEALLELKKEGKFHLCQEFIWHNPSRLPSPIQWVNIERIRVKDSFSRFWWLSPSERPKADNRNVLKEYSESMKKLLVTQTYSSGRRPSEHIIGKESFLKNNKGAIPANVLIHPNTSSKDEYLDYCNENNIKYHPARMPRAIAEFFIKLLTSKGDLVLDPFAGSNITGYVAEDLHRRWRSIEIDEIYVSSSRARFPNSWLL